MAAVPQRGTSDWFLTHFAALESRLNGTCASPVHEKRKLGFKAFQSTGFPAPKDENWKYTNISPFVRDGFVAAGRDTEHTLELSQIAPYILNGLDASLLVFVDGKLNASLSRMGERRNFHFASLEQVSKGATGPSAEVVLKDFAEVADCEKHSFTALNTALVEDGAVLVFSKECLGEVVQIMHVSTESCADAITFPRVLVRAESGSESTVIESFVGTTERAYFSNAVSEVSVESNARLHHYKLVFEGPNATHVGKVAVDQASDSFFQSLCFTTEGKLVRNEVDQNLRGSGIDSRLFGLTVLGGAQHVDNTTVIDHCEPHSESTELYKGIYAEKSKGVFSGTIIVRPDAQKTNAIQNNQSLLLSDTAESNSKPQLKIWADDVKCTHGATIGQLDADALFYLRSRGIDVSTAKGMLIHAFASDVLRACNSEVVSHYLEERLMDKLVRLQVSQESQVSPTLQTR